MGSKNSRKMLTEDRTRPRTHLKVVRTLVHRVALDLLLAPQRGSMDPPAVLLRHRPLQSPRSRSQLIDSC